jgi:hypothetical protein
MKKYMIVGLSLILCIVLCSCASSQQGSSTDPSSVPPAQGEPAPDKSPANSDPAQSTAASSEAELEAEAVTYPFEDDEGRVHHQIYINGELAETDHDAYTYPDEPKGAYYPIVEILEHFGVESLFDENLVTLSTKINGQIITCNADNTDIVVGKVTLGGTAPEYIDGCFYVPSYTFMQLLDATVDFTSGRNGVTMTTDMIIDPDTSGVAGLSISPKAAAGLGEQHYSGAEACSACGGTGRSICTVCSGTGSVTQFSQSRDPITGQMTIKNARAFCSRCGGSGRTTCSLCGGSGKR